jgi:hypothetical protein
VLIRFSPSSSATSSTAVSSGNHEEDTQAHIEKTVICVLPSDVLPSNRLARSRRHGGFGAVARAEALQSPVAPVRRTDAERIGEEPWHELRSKIVSSV